MPRKIRELLRDYRAAGFSIVSKQGKGSHRKLRHPLLSGSILVAGQEGDDAKLYQEQDLQEALDKLKKARGKP